MAAKKETPLPEVVMTEGPMVALAAILGDVKVQESELEARNDEAKKALASQATEFRMNKVANDDYIGMIRINGEQAPVRVEFRTNKKLAALSLEDGPVIDELYGAARMLLWEKELIITGVTDPVQLISDLTAAGLNPWEYLNVTVKPGMERIVADKSKAVLSWEAFLPVKGFLNTVRDIIHNWSDNAKSYFRAYMKVAVEPYIITGPVAKKGE